MTQNYYYILGPDFEVIEIDDLIKWGEWFETANRHVAKTKIGSTEISTVFLGLNHNLTGNTPILWETMVFGLGFNDPLYDYQERYATFDEAKAGHQRAVEFVKKKLYIND